MDLIGLIKLHEFSICGRSNLSMENADGFEHFIVPEIKGKERACKTVGIQSVERYYFRFILS